MITRTKQYLPEMLQPSSAFQGIGPAGVNECPQLISIHVDISFQGNTFQEAEEQ